jgi:hypothetical protein
MVGLRDTRIILVQAPRDALRPVRKDVLYAHGGLVVGGTSLGRKRESVPSLWCGCELPVLNECYGALFVLLVMLFAVPAYPFIVQGGLVYKG